MELNYVDLHAKQRGGPGQTETRHYLSNSSSWVQQSSVSFAACLTGPQGDGRG